MRSFTRRELVLGAALAGVACGGKRVDDSPAALESEAAVVDPLAAVNARWIEHLCHLREPIPIGKRRKKAGWSWGPWVTAPELRGAKKLRFRLGVSDRLALEENDLIVAGNELRAGTSFVAEHWWLKKPNDGRGLSLQLELLQRPVKLQLEVRGPDRASDIEQVDRVIRREILQVLSRRR